MKHGLPIINPEIDTLPELQALINGSEYKKTVYDVDYTWETFFDEISSLL
jgi:hypothetical protein